MDHFIGLDTIAVVAITLAALISILAALKGGHLYEWPPRFRLGFWMLAPCATAQSPRRGAHRLKSELKHIALPAPRATLRSAECFGHADIPRNPLDLPCRAVRPLTATPIRSAP